MAWSALHKMELKSSYGCRGGRKWITREQEGIDSLSEWLKAVGFLILKQMKGLSWSKSANATSVFKEPDTAKVY